MSRPTTQQTKSRGQNAMPASHNRNSGSFVPGGEAPGSNGPGYFANTNGRERGSAQFDLARSPPNGASNKNTKHVPCKFFRQGACQAGNACPFSHSLDPMMQQAPCKYFMKGNCKFGAKCALAHYLPNGHRVSRADLDPGMPASNSRGGFGSNNRPEGQHYISPEPFTDPFVAQPYAAQDFFPNQDPFLLDEEDNAYPDNYNQSRLGTGFENALSSPPASQFGSPPNDNGFQRHTTDMRSALNAPLPASFDANSLPHIAKYGPFGQSVPDQFGMRSPPTSILSRKLGSPTEGTVGVKSTIGTALRNVSSPLSISPQNNSDDAFGRRTMHSQKTSRPQIISASVPRTSVQHNWDDNLGTETDLLPNSLHDEVLLPQEKMRRLSRPDEMSSSLRDRSDSGLNIPRRGSSTVGSPPMGSSPSRFRGLFEEQRKREEAGNPSMASANQNFGHVGSPLRESWMPHESADNGASRSASVQISGITQQMARMEFNRTESSETNGSSRPFAGGLRNSFNLSSARSPALSGRRIDEEGEGAFFEMDDENNRRSGSGWPLPQPIHPPGSFEPIRTISSKLDESSGSGGGTGSAGITISNGARPIFGFRS